MQLRRCDPLIAAQHPTSYENTALRHSIKPSCLIENGSIVSLPNNG
jgi:hypothetical protein